MTITGPAPRSGSMSHVYPIATTIVSRTHQRDTKPVEPAAAAVRPRGAQQPGPPETEPGSLPRAAQRHSRQTIVWAVLCCVPALAALAPMAALIGLVVPNPALVFVLMLAVLGAGGAAGQLAERRARHHAGGAA